MWHFLRPWAACLIVAVCAGTLTEDYFFGELMRTHFAGQADWLRWLIYSTGLVAAPLVTLTCVGLSQVPALTSTASRSLLSGLLVAVVTVGLWCVVFPPSSHGILLITVDSAAPPAEIANSVKTSLSQISRPVRWPPFGADYAGYLQALAAIFTTFIVLGSLTRNKAS